MNWKRGPGRALKIDAAHMSRAAGPDSCGRCLVWVCLELGDQFLSFAGKSFRAVMGIGPLVNTPAQPLSIYVGPRAKL